MASRMDARAYLTKQGWKGDGHSLDHTGKGIKKPLLVSKKVDVLGVGLNKHAAVNDQWWLRAFDEGLKNFGTGKTSILSTVQQHGIHRGGLYGRFVKGEGVPGTFGERVESSSEVESTPSTGTQTPVETISTIGEKSESKKRKRADEAGEPGSKAKKAYANELAEKRAAKKEKRALRKSEKEENAAETRKQRKASQGSKTDKYASQKAKRETKAAEKLESLSKKSAGELTREDKKALAKSTAKSKSSKGRSAFDSSTPEGESRSGTTTPTIPSEKLAAYKERAAQKGVSLEAYMQRRQEKSKRTTKDAKS